MKHRPHSLLVSSRRQSSKTKSQQRNQLKNQLRSLLRNQPKNQSISQLRTSYRKMLLLFPRSTKLRRKHPQAILIRAERVMLKTFSRWRVSKRPNTSTELSPCQQLIFRWARKRRKQPKLKLTNLKISRRQQRSLRRSSTRKKFRNNQLRHQEIWSRRVTFQANQRLFI